MPSLRLFNRRTIIAGDELQPVSVSTVILRILQLLFLLLPISCHIFREKSSQNFDSWLDYLLFDQSSENECRHSHLHVLLLCCYTLASILYAIASIYLEWRIAYWSSQDRPTKPEPRSSHVATLMEFKLVPCTICLFLIWLAGISALSFAPIYYHCLEASKNGGNNDDNNNNNNNNNLYINDQYERNMQLLPKIYNSFAHHQLWWLAYAILLIMQAAEVFFAWMYLFITCRFSATTMMAEVMDNIATVTTDDSGNTSHNHHLAEQMWADRCAFSCRFLSIASCFMFGGRELLGEAEFGHIARALADYLETRGTLDVAPSDVIVGLLILKRIQRQRIYKARQAVMQEVVGRTNAMEEGYSRPYSDNNNNNNNPNSNTAGGEDLLTSLESTNPSEIRASVMRSNYNNNSLNNNNQGSLYRLDNYGNIERCARNILIPQNFDDLAAIEEGARYSRFALAIYTWIFYLYDHPCTGPVNLLAHTKCTCCCKRAARRNSRQSLTSLIDEDGMVEGDNMCEFNKTALLLTLKLDNVDLIYANMRNGLDQTPYAIIVDHGWKTVVLVVRGTFSLEDCLTDVLLEPESLEQLGKDFDFDATNQYSHSGVLSCVRSVYRDLQRHGHLERLLLGNNAIYPDYTLRLTGHSLGAATCTILSYMLRKKYPSLRCINFSPPGCSMTWELAVGCHSWCTSFVLNADLVSRMSLESMEKLRDEILVIIGRIKIPKIEVVSKLIKTSSWNAFQYFTDIEQSEQEVTLQSLEEILYKEDEVPPDSEYTRQLEHFKNIQNERRTYRGPTRAVRLFPPGKFIHLTKTGGKKTIANGVAKCLTCCTTNIGSEYVPMWINNDDLNEIVVSGTMGTDHFTDRMCHILESVAQDFGIQR